MKRRDPPECRQWNLSPGGATLAAKRRPLISRGRKPSGKRLGWKFSARKRGMYRRRPRRRLWKRAEPAPAPRQRRDRIPPSEARRKESDESDESDERKKRRAKRGGKKAPEGRPAPRSGACPDGALAVGRKRQRRGDVRHASSLPVPDHTFSLFETITGKPTKNKAIIQSELSLKRQN